MPCVVSRWHLVLLKKPLSARYLNEFTVCGVFAASIANLMSPAFVFSAMSYLRLGVDGHLRLGRRRWLSGEGLLDGDAASRLLVAVAGERTRRVGRAARRDDHREGGRDDGVAAPGLAPRCLPALLLPLELLARELAPTLFAADHRSSPCAVS